MMLFVDRLILILGECVLKSRFPTQVGGNAGSIYILVGKEEADESLLEY